MICAEEPEQRKSVGEKQPSWRVVRQAKSICEPVLLFISVCTNLWTTKSKDVEN
jgi:hypothetical protein